MDLRVFFYRKFVVGQGRERSIAREFLEKMRKNRKPLFKNVQGKECHPIAAARGLAALRVARKAARVDDEHRPLHIRGKSTFIRMRYCPYLCFLTSKCFTDRNIKQNISEM